jgi:ATP-dependent RNA helicase SUPV3L1/SUV3
MQRLAASGRTSFPVDKDVPRTFYRTIGYRVCGERAVRVDILERLADLIRPALSWRPGSPAPQPAGTFEGIGFTVTQAMTSLTGSSGEDFASILRALGYRMEKRPKPAPVHAPVTEAPTPETNVPVAADMETASGGETAGVEPATGDELAADAAVPTVEAEDGEEAAGQGVSGNQAPSHELPSDEVPGHDMAHQHSASQESSGPEFTSEESTPHEPAPVDLQASSGEPAEAAEQSAHNPALSAEDDAAGMAEAGASEASVAAAADAPPAEPELVEVWRPGGRSDERRSQQRRPQHQRAHPSHGEGASRGAQAEGVVAEAGNGAEVAGEVAAPAEKKGDHFRRPRGPQGDFRRERQEGGDRRQREQRADQRPDRQADRPERGRGERPNNYGKDGARSRGDHKDRRDFTPHREREKQADPNSPFAKLAALKAQLEAAAKERR